jgi:tetratricopeptide (TPR) repeat protein
MVRALFALTFLLLVGCDDGANSGSRTLEIEDPDFRQGQLYQKQGEPRKALECFLKVIDARKGAAEAHLEAGRMYSDLQDPLPAIYHFNQYIRLKPNSQQSAIVIQMIKQAEKQFMQQIPGRPLGGDGSTALNTDAAGELRRLRAENDRLKKDLADLNRGIKPAENKVPTLNLGTDKPEATTETKPAAGARTYTVVKGDTPSSISRKVYGNGLRANDILKANKDKVPNAASLKIGMVLVIPE